MTARELADKRVVVQTRVTSMLAWQATITQASMSAPAGYELQPASPELQALFPVQVRLLLIAHPSLLLWVSLALPQPLAVPLLFHGPSEDFRSFSFLIRRPVPYLLWQTASNCRLYGMKHCRPLHATRKSPLACFRVLCGLKSISAIQVAPGATVMLLHFLVLKHAVSRLARSSASTLQLHFTLNAAQRAQQRPCQVDSGWAQPHLAPEQLPFPPSNPSPPEQVGCPF